MRKNGFLFLAFFVCMISFAKRPTDFSANYIGEKMWNTQTMVPYFGSVSLEIIDTVAYLKYTLLERVDTFYYKGVINDCFEYIRNKNRLGTEYLRLSGDSLNLQVGMPMEQNYFYKLSSINTVVVCLQCLGTGTVLCTRCGGTGRVKPVKNGSPDEMMGLCPYCHGSKSMTFSPCRQCGGKGVVKVKRRFKVVSQN